MDLLGRFHYRRYPKTQMMLNVNGLQSVSWAGADIKGQIAQRVTQEPDYKFFLVAICGITEISGSVRLNDIFKCIVARWLIWIGWAWISLVITQKPERCIVAK